MKGENKIWRKARKLSAFVDSLPYDIVSRNDIDKLIHSRINLAISLVLCDSSFGIDANNLSIYFLPMEPFDEKSSGTEWKINKIAKWLLPSSGCPQMYEDEKLEVLANALSAEAEKIKRFIKRKRSSAI